MAIVRKQAKPENIFTERRSGQDRRCVTSADRPVILHCRRLPRLERRTRPFRCQSENWWLQVNYLDSEYIAYTNRKQ